MKKTGRKSRLQGNRGGMPNNVFGTRLDGMERSLGGKGVKKKR